MRHPKDKFSWEITNTKKIVKYMLAKLGPGDFFGHSEIMDSKNWPFEVKCCEKTELLYLNKEQYKTLFLNSFDEFTANRLDFVENNINSKSLFIKIFCNLDFSDILKREHPEFDKNAIMNVILGTNTVKSMIKKATFDGLFKSDSEVVPNFIFITTYYL